MGFVEGTKYKFACSECGESFPKQKDLTEHFLTHITRLKVYKLKKRRVVKNGNRKKRR
jgi:hypothetical protein